MALHQWHNAHEVNRRLAKAQQRDADVALLRKLADEAEAEADRHFADHTEVYGVGNGVWSQYAQDGSDAMVAARAYRKAADLIEKGETTHG